MTLVVVFAAVFVGALLQRVSGMGLGLITSPILMIIFGPIEGVLIVNLLATINAAASTFTLWRSVDWRMIAVIGPALVAGIIPGSFLVRELPTAPLLILVGVLLLLALGIVTVGKRYVPPIDGRVPAAVAGAVGGFMNTLAGAAGPAITVYAQAARWDQRRYAATLQPIFFIAGLGSLCIKLLLGAANFDAVELSVWPVGVAALTIGLLMGVRVAPRVPRTTGRAIALSLAGVGGVTSVVRGVMGVLH